MTIPGRFGSTAVIAPHVAEQLAEAFDEIRYYPRIDDTDVRPLKGLGDDRFVPNLDLVEPDTVVALETNQEFIEAYMVGRQPRVLPRTAVAGVPHRQRGTYFRQFWDVAAT